MEVYFVIKVLNSMKKYDCPSLELNLKVNCWFEGGEYACKFEISLVTRPAK